MAASDMARQVRRSCAQAVKSSRARMGVLRSRGARDCEPAQIGGVNPRARGATASNCHVVTFPMTTLPVPRAYRGRRRRKSDVAPRSARNGRAVGHDLQGPKFQTPILLCNAHPGGKRPSPDPAGTSHQHRLFDVTAVSACGSPQSPDPVISSIRTRAWRPVGHPSPNVYSPPSPVPT